VVCSKWGGGEAWEEERLLLKVERIFERGSLLEPGNLEQEVPLELLRDLMQSSKPDLAIIGTRLLWFWRQRILSIDTDWQTLMKKEESSRNFARYLVAEFPQEMNQKFARHAIGVSPQFGKYVEEFIDRTRPENDFLSAGAMASGHQSTPSNPSGPDMTIIIHGTHALSSNWWKRGSNFWNYLDTEYGNLYLGRDHFSWTGADDDPARALAAHDLFAWGQTHPCQNLDIIAHSHAGNVAFSATQIGLKVNRLITLGTPIRLENIPKLSNIKELHNIYSLGDKIQRTVGTWFSKRNEGRTLGDTNKVFNHLVSDNGLGTRPSHPQLHEELTWKRNKIIDKIENP